MTTPWTRPPGTAPTLALSPLAGAFNREWRRDYERRRAPAPAEWQTDARLAGYAAVVDALGELEDGATRPERVEEILAALVERGAAGDRDATRLLVQYLMPCLARVAYSRGGGERFVQDALDELVTVAWEIASVGVDLRGRTAKIAMLRTIEYRALRKPARAAARQRRREVLVGAMGDALADRARHVDPGWRDDLVTDGSGCALSSAPNAGEDVVRLLAEAAGGGVSASDARLIGSLVVGWSTCQGLAVADGITDRSVRYRRAAALGRLANWAA
jgi:hypothetical protein